MGRERKEVMRWKHRNTETSLISDSCSWCVDDSCALYCTMRWCCLWPDFAFPQNIRKMDGTSGPPRFRIMMNDGRHTMSCKYMPSASQSESVSRSESTVVISTMNEHTHIQLRWNLHTCKKGCKKNLCMCCYKSGNVFCWPDLIAVQCVTEYLGLFRAKLD